MLGQRIPHPKSTNFDDKKLSPHRPAKRLKREESDDVSEVEFAPSPSPSKHYRDEVPDSDADSDAEDLDETDVHRQTDLESALPPIKTDREAIEEYEAQYTRERRLQDGTWVRGKSSIYVDAFNLALDTVLEEESHLFDEAELEVFKVWRNLAYESQYLYVRLFLRKSDTWHRINKLGYHSDIADLDAAIGQLQEERSLPASTSEAQDNPGELEPPQNTTLGPMFSFADSSDLITTLEEASSLLLLDELKLLAKDAKAVGKNKKELLKSLRQHSQRQTGLNGFATLKRSDTEETTASIGSGPDYDDVPGSNRDAHFLRKIFEFTGPCIRLSSPTHKLFERVHLVFYRSTEWTEKSLTTIILARIARRNFPSYIVSRSTNIFPSRSILLEFEASLRTQFAVDTILQFNGTPKRGDLHTVLEIHEQVYPRWKALLKIEQEKEDSIYASGEGAYLRRLSPAWVYTRIVHKGAYVLGKMKQHKREHTLLSELLSQRLFHASRRGDWYQRKALLEEHYMFDLTPSPPGITSDDAKRKHWKRVALATCEEGLQDQEVHIIYHYDLQKRVMKLEKQLKVAKRLQHDFGHVRLAKPVEVYVDGTQVIRESAREEGKIRPSFVSSDRRNSSPHPGSRRSTKTIWLDPLSESGEEHCSVEAMCLSNYRTQGWKGYHSEGGIVRTLFAYLFYDILFTYIPNVFQTEFQTCPLDLHTDGFFATRMGEVNRRLAEIGNGDAKAILKGVWEEHHERKTCVVGLDWSFELEDLLEIATCFGGEALSTICLVMAQEYAARGGGVPDLFLWRTGDGEIAGKGEVMFAEVKSENDRLSDTQRLWIHVLTGAGVRVELCNAVAKDFRYVP